MFEKVVFKWLDVALDYGITEIDFWNMTLAEVIRAIESKKRIQRLQAQEKASFDYIHADLIGRSVARLHSSSNRMPQLAEVYPSLFEAEEIAEQLQEKKNKLSVLRFKQFAQSHNNKFKEVEKGE